MLLLLVTLDPIGNAICISTFLHTFVQSELEPENFPGVDVRPVFCTDIETLERTVPSLRLHSLSDILERWYQFNELRSMPLSSVPMHDWMVTPDEIDKQAWKKVCEEAIKHLGIQPGKLA